MNTNRICPKCKTGRMYTIGGGCNYRCELCGHTYYEAPPRVHVSKGPSEEMRRISRDLDAAHQQTQDALREMRYASKEYSRASRQARETRKQAAKADKKQGSWLGTLVVILIVLWLIGQFG